MKANKNIIAVSENNLKAIELKINERLKAFFNWKINNIIQLHHEVVFKPTPKIIKAWTNLSFNYPGLKELLIDNTKNSICLK